MARDGGPGDQSGTVAGHRLTGRTRISELGAWHDAIGPAGYPTGLLRFDSGLLAAPGARERLVAAVTADRRLEQGGTVGLLPLADLVSARGEVWLISGRRAMPTVADLLTDGGAHADAGSVASILVETAQALLAVHAAGLTHGALHPGTIVIADDGVAMLAERGLLEALRGEPVSVSRDIAAWSGLARGLAASWSSGPVARLFDRAASVAAAHGLADARDTLMAGRDALPPGFTARERLIVAVHTWSSSPVAVAAPTQAVPDTGEMVTLLDPGLVRSPTAGDGSSERNFGAAGALGAAGAVSGMRFGPGVPAETTASQIWRQGRDQPTRQDTGRHGGGRAAPPKRPGKAKTGFAGTVLVAILLAAVVLWLRQTPPLELKVVGVKVSAPKDRQKCDSRTKVSGTVTTNGGEGSFTYVWKQSDGGELRKTFRVLEGQTTVTLPLLWSVQGKGTFRAVATLQVLDHTKTGKPIQGKASFSYKC